MVAPAAPVTLADKIAINAALLGSGASIRELNVVRRHLSAIKGGGLLRACGGARVLSLILSDVANNDLATIGSGPTAADPTTFAEAVGVLKRRNLWGRAPETIRDRLERGSAGEIAETVKPGDPLLERADNIVIGDNRLAVEAAAGEAVAAGYAVDRWRELYGEADDVGRALSAHLSAIGGARVCVVAGESRWSHTRARTGRARAAGGARDGPRIGTARSRPPHHGAVPVPTELMGRLTQPARSSRRARPSAPRGGTKSGGGAAAQRRQSAIRRARRFAGDGADGDQCVGYIYWIGQLLNRPLTD